MKNKYSFFSKKKNGLVMAFAAKETKSSVWLEVGTEKVIVPKRNKTKEDEKDATEEIQIPIIIKKKRSQVELVTDEKVSTN